MTSNVRPPIRVDCTECPFSRIVEPGDSDLAATVVRDHGQETGHRLSIDPLDGTDDLS